MFNRQIARSSRTFIRNNSTQQKAQEKAGEVASKAQEKAGEVASKAQAQAKSAAVKAQAAVSGIAGKVSSATSSVFGLQEPIIYWGKVAGQVAKQVYQAEKMSPPSMAQFESTYKSLFKSVTSRGSFNAFKTMSTKDAVKLGVDGLTIYGFFVVGEMIGRRHVSDFSFSHNTMGKYSMLMVADGRLRSLDLSNTPKNISHEGCRIHTQTNIIIDTTCNLPSLLVWLRKD